MLPEDTDIRVVVVADDHLARAGLAALLGDQPGCIVAGQTDPAQFASADPDLYRADVAVWDLGWQPERSLEYLADAANTQVTAGWVTWRSRAAPVKVPWVATA